MTIEKAFIEKWKLDEEEIALLEAEEKITEPSHPKNKKELMELSQIAANNTLEKLKQNKSITIRVNESVLNKIKAKSLSMGIPYQTLIN